MKKLIKSTLGILSATTLLVGTFQALPVKAAGTDANDLCEIEIVYVDDNDIELLTSSQTFKYECSAMDTCGALKASTSYMTVYMSRSTIGSAQIKISTGSYATNSGSSLVATLYPPAASSSTTTTVSSHVTVTKGTTYYFMAGPKTTGNTTAGSFSVSY